MTAWPCRRGSFHEHKASERSYLWHALLVGLLMPETLVWNVPAMALAVAVGALEA